MRILFLVGSGALVDPWAPVIKALRETEYPAVNTGDGANFAMAQLIYGMRMTWFLASKVETDADGKAKEQARKIYTGVRQRIASELRDAEAHGKLQVRPEFEAVARTFALETGNVQGKVSIATTNWDRTVISAAQKIATGFAVKPIHGTSAAQQTLYLPTEVVKEPYRDYEEERRMGGVHVGLLESAEHADRVVLYGLSLSPLDTELGAMLMYGLWHGPMSEVYIVDPWYTPIAERVATLMDPGRMIPIRCYRPTNLDSKSEWTYKASDRAAEDARLKQRNESP